MPGIGLRRDRRVSPEDDCCSLRDTDSAYRETGTSIVESVDRCCHEHRMLMSREMRSA